MVEFFKKHYYYFINLKNIKNYLCFCRIHDRHASFLLMTTGNRVLRDFLPLLKITNRKYIHTIASCSRPFLW